MRDLERDIEKPQRMITDFEREREKPEMIRPEKTKRAVKEDEIL